MSVALVVERKIPRGNFPVCGLYECRVGIGLRRIVIFGVGHPLWVGLDVWATRPPLV